MYDDDYGGGCGGFLGLLMLVAAVMWISDNWEMILLAVVSLIAIGIIIALIRSHEASASAKEAQAIARAEEEAAEKKRRERESYDRYFAAQGGAYLNGRLNEANEIVRRLFNESDEEKRTKILAFFDKYLPLITEIIEASKHGNTDIDESLDRFTQTVKAFSKSLYKVDDVVGMNQTIMESMAIRDGLYDPYAEAFRLDVDKDAGNTVPEVDDEKLDEELLKDIIDDAILLEDYDLIRDMLDSGEISEEDLDYDVLNKVEEYV